MASPQAPVIIIRKKKGGGHGGHHGGAWKVAYADFVTAMMSFFLLLWLLNVTTDVERKGIADYFAPASVSKSESGAGGIARRSDYHRRRRASLERIAADNPGRYHPHGRSG